MTVSTGGDTRSVYLKAASREASVGNPGKRMLQRRRPTVVAARCFGLQNGETALLRAARLGFVQATRLLLDRGADAEATTNVRLRCCSGRGCQNVWKRARSAGCVGIGTSCISCRLWAAK